MEKFNAKIWLSKADYILQMQETDPSPCLGAFKLAVRLIAEKGCGRWLDKTISEIYCHARAAGVSLSTAHHDVRAS